LIKKILNTDCEKRYTIEEIRRHQWYQQVNAASHIKEGILVSKEKIPVINFYKKKKLIVLQ
jgi:hypothetical protein